MIHLILGGARSGKSRFALEWANQRAGQRALVKQFIATAEAFDDEMSERIQRHQQERGSDWLLSEVPLTLADHLGAIAAQEIAAQEIAAQKHAQIVLVDCLTLWLNNQLYHRPDQDVEQMRSTLVEAVGEFGGRSQSDLVLVANEVGLGIVPMGEVSRVFVDQAGWLNQALAQVADQVTFVAAGLPMTLKIHESLKNHESLTRQEQGS